MFYKTEKLFSFLEKNHFLRFHGYKIVHKKRLGHLHVSQSFL
jgi:hypothetical protein